MAMTSLSIVLTVFVLQLHHVGPNTKPVPGWVKKILMGCVARMLLMNRVIHDFYRYREEVKKDEMCLTSFMDNIGANTKDSNNCNGRVGQKSRGSFRGTSFKENSFRQGGLSRQDSRRNVSYDKISNHLKILVSKHDSEDDYQDIISEWRLVAHIMDRFLFWLFLVAAVLSSVSILVFRPMMKPSI